MRGDTLPVETGNALSAWHWEPQPAAEKFVRGIVSDFLQRVPYAANLARRMTDETGTRFFDWIDSIKLPASAEPQLIAAGFSATASDIAGVFMHGGGMFPTLVIGSHDRVQVTIRVESIADFAAANGLPLQTDEPPLSPYRRMVISRGDYGELWIAERHGFRGFAPPEVSSDLRIRMLAHRQKFRTRRRDFASDAEGFGHVNDLLDAAIAEIGVDVTCDLFFYAEREYWQRRNLAARVQKARQDRLGLGWANHDHHTYRSSRDQFVPLITTLEKLGFICRERFYAGAQAGWGAQVLEQVNARIVIFADVDLAPEELLNDFSHESLPPMPDLGTVGLWCALHGEAFLQAGMHHLECQFDFDALKQQMESTGVKVMKPFTNFPYLRQAFTEGEVWPVMPDRLKRLGEQGLITEEQAHHFQWHGAIGSHLENLERNEGFKGFNQTGVSDIISRTDPRHQAGK